MRGFVSLNLFFPSSLLTHHAIMAASLQQAARINATSFQAGKPALRRPRAARIQVSQPQTDISSHFASLLFTRRYVQRCASCCSWAHVVSPRAKDQVPRQGNESSEHLEHTIRPQV